jgi:hypothetical protein
MSSLRLVLLLSVFGCNPSPAPRSFAKEPASAVASSLTDAAASVTADTATAAVVVKEAFKASVDVVDGNDEEDESELAPLKPGTWQRVGAAPLALQRICDLRPFGGALYGAHARQPLGIDGATITRYGRFGDPSKPLSFQVAFDWNRPGEPTKGGGAGQGFVRVHNAGNRLFVPDADSPYAGFGVADWGTEGFVFVSDTNGKFAPPSAPQHRPPARPTLEKPGAAVLPRAYHVIDTIRYRGHTYASTGSVPPKERAWSGPSPGALHVANEDLSKWEYLLRYPIDSGTRAAFVAPANGVWRLTYMVRFRGKLLAGIQDYEGIDPNSYVVFTQAKDHDVLTQEDLRVVALPDAKTDGGTMTLRWYTSRGKLYWIGFGRRYGVRAAKLRVSDDGQNWREIALPGELGRPTDVKRAGGQLLVLMERGLVRLDDGETVEVLEEITDKKAPFVLDDFFCAAPLAVFEGKLYAGGQRDGALYRFDVSDAQ